jgi:hypothetical protein
VLTVGTALHEWQHGRIDAVVNVGPLECMPSKIAEAQLFLAAEREGLLSLSLPLNGDPIDPEVILKRHGNDLFDYRDDAVLILDVTPGSPTRCQAVPLDLGQGNYPQVLAEQQVYDADPRAALQTLVFEETEEDTNGNGVLDPGEDTDMDGVLDHPNTRDGKPGSMLLDFYERESNTLIMKPLMPMREATTYATVLTTRLVSPGKEPVRSPFEGTVTPALPRGPRSRGTRMGARAAFVRVVTRQPLDRLCEARRGDNDEALSLLARQQSNHRGD